MCKEERRYNTTKIHFYILYFSLIHACLIYMLGIKIIKLYFKATVYVRLGKTRNVHSGWYIWEF